MKTIEILTDPSMERVRFAKHGFFTRNGGVSKGSFSSLNCSYSQDDKIAVEENRRRAMDHLGRPFSSLITCFNMHDNKAVAVDKFTTNLQAIEGDGLVTKDKDVVLGAVSADCPVIIFADEESQVIGIAHAGWRGARSGILESTVEKMIFLGAKSESILASVGPCIAQSSYEVGLDVYEIFVNENEINKIYFEKNSNSDNFWFDLRGYVCDKLRKLGIKNPSYLDVDTYQQEEQFFSRRRSYHRSDNLYGCQLGVIYFNT